MDQQALIERIVAEVMGKLRPAQATAPVGAAAAVEPRFRLSQDVITADLLAENAAGQNSVEVSSRAIVTPSAKDWLRHNRVELTRGTKVQVGSTAKTSDWLVVVHSAGETVERVLEDAARSGSIGSDRESVANATSAAKAAGEAVARSGRGVVVISGEPEVVACLANRIESVRAAVVADAAAVARVKAGLNGNVFVVDPAGRSYFELRNLLKQIAQ
jgi:hypothetical protein